MPSRDGAALRRAPLYVRVITLAAVLCWFALTPVVSLVAGFYESWLQVLHAPDERYAVHCYAAWLGPFQQSVGFAASPVGDADGARTVMVVDVDTRLAYEGYRLHRRRPVIGEFSEQLVADGLRATFPHVTPEEIDLAAADVYRVMFDSIRYGVGGMTFWDEEQGGALAEGRLRTLNAYGGPGTAVILVFGRLFITFAVMAGIGIALWVARRVLLKRFTPNGSGPTVQMNAMA